MITIYCSTDNREGYDEFIEIPSPTNYLRVCLTTISNKVYCYNKNVDNLNLHQIKRIVIGKNTTDIPYHIIIWEIPNYLYYLSTEHEDDHEGGTGTPPQPNNEPKKNNVYVMLKKKLEAFKNSKFIY